MDTRGYRMILGDIWGIQEGEGGYKGVQGVHLRPRFRKPD